MAEIETDKISFYKDNNWYYLENNTVEIPYAVLQLGSGSTSSTISSAIGGTAGFVDINVKLHNGARPYSIFKVGTQTSYFTFLQAAALSTNSLLFVFQRCPLTLSWAALTIYRMVITTNGSGTFSIQYQSGELTTD